MILVVGECEKLVWWRYGDDLWLIRCGVKIECVGKGGGEEKDGGGVTELLKICWWGRVRERLIFLWGFDW